MSLQWNHQFILQRKVHHQVTLVQVALIVKMKVSKFVFFCKGTVVPLHKYRFSIKDFFNKCDQFHRKLRIWSHLLKIFLMEKFIFLGQCSFNSFYVNVPVCNICCRIMEIIERYQGLSQQFIACDNRNILKYFRILHIIAQIFKYFALFCLSFNIFWPFF